MHIDAYAFGSMTVGGKTRRRDLLLLPDRVVDGWWREEGHSLSRADLAEVFAARPDVLVVGTGAMGVMAVPEETRAALAAAGIALAADRTAEAVGRYNALAAAGRRVAGAFHLTC